MLLDRVRMQSVPHYAHISHTYIFIPYNIPWQDFKIISASLPNFKSYCTSCDLGDRPNTKKIKADPQLLHEKTHLLAFNPQKKHVVCLISIMGEKYQKLCRHSKRKFSSN